MARLLFVVIGIVLLLVGISLAVIGLTGLSVVNQCAPFCQTSTEGDFLAYVFIGGGAFLSIIGAVLLGAGIMKSGKKAIFCHSCGASVDSHSVF